MKFTEAVQYLLSLGHETLAMKLGLRSPDLLLAALGKPQRSLRSVQIAGTNGKGSTAVMLDSICRAAGINTGLYTSPHLTSITERIRINSAAISEDDFATLITTVRETSELLVAQGTIEALPTFFEQVTAAALLAYAPAKVDLAILETGLGGRLDATTAAGAEIVALTPIAMDHEQYLGNTLEEITAEKAAIIRPGVRAVLAEQDPRALQVILDRCKETQVEPVQSARIGSPAEASPEGRFCVTFQTDQHVYDRLWLGLLGQHQSQNAATAISLAEILNQSGFKISQKTIREGIENARHPGRLELIPGAPSFLLDGAHNPAGALALRRYLDDYARRPLTLIFGAMRDKQLDQMAGILFPVADLVVLTEIDNARSATTENLVKLATTAGVSNAVTASSSTDALQKAIAGTQSSGLICVTGSLYLIGELRPRLISRSSEP
ncbi:MAG TPA: folylpolyglutamate synthase/dihydrofolate synthase family protein [Pyrinomonadaceae bacterium]|nr:folylpolyglutamate synthase/dihydrofolate synthase family protein [Pyrinomonadaceae bacterium]